MKDFIGQELKVGSYVAMGGSGNSSAEYGMILFRITDIARGKIKAERLKVRYPTFKLSEAVVSKSNVTLTKPGRLVKVSPQPAVKKVFKNFDEYTKVIGPWIHKGEANWEKV